MQLGRKTNSTLLSEGIKSHLSNLNAIQFTTQGLPITSGTLLATVVLSIFFFFLVLSILIINFRTYIHYLRSNKITKKSNRTIKSRHNHCIQLTAEEQILKNKQESNKEPLRIVTDGHCNGPLSLKKKKILSLSLWCPEFLLSSLCSPMLVVFTHTFAIDSRWTEGNFLPLGFGFGHMTCFINDISVDMMPTKA